MSKAKDTAPVMSARIEVGDLKAALGSVIAAVERKNTIPILANVKLAFSAGVGLEATATNLDMQVSRTVPVSDVGHRWATTVAAHVLKGMVDKLPAGCEVLLQLGDGRLTLTAGRARFALPVLPVEDFPELVQATDTVLVQFETGGAEWLAQINQVKHAISTEETRYYLNGICLERAEAELLMVATDGHRLAVSARAAPDGSEALPELGGVIIPRGCLGVVEALCAESRIDVTLTARMLRIEAGEVVMISKLIDGTFPDWRRVVPGGNDKIVSVDPKALAEAVGRVATIASDKTRAVKMTASAGRLTLSVTSPENGTATEDMDADYTGPDVEIGFNGSYLLGVLGKFSGDAVRFELMDASGPALIRTSAEARDRHVLMPMRV